MVGSRHLTMACDCIEIEMNFGCCFRMGSLEIRLRDDQAGHLFGNALRIHTQKRGRRPTLREEEVKLWCRLSKELSLFHTELRVGWLFGVVPSRGTGAGPLGTCTDRPWTQAMSRSGHGDGGGGFRMTSTGWGFVPSGMPATGAVSP